MCGRYALSTSLPELAELFEAEIGMDDPGPRFNIAPTDTIPVLRAREGGREIVGLRWGLVPGWSHGPEDVPLIINARVESLEERPAFRDLLQGRRCAVLADGFYEWRSEEGGKQPYYVRRRDGHPLALAALWDRWGVGEETLESCAIITTDANDLLAPVHDRMPAILSPDAVGTWLTRTSRSEAETDAWTAAGLPDLFAPYPSDRLEAFPVTRRVNHVANDDPELIEPSGEPVHVAEGAERASRPASRRSGGPAGPAHRGAAAGGGAAEEAGSDGTRSDETGAAEPPSDEEPPSGEQLGLF